MSKAVRYSVVPDKLTVDDCIRHLTHDGPFHETIGETVAALNLSSDPDDQSMLAQGSYFFIRVTVEVVEEVTPAQHEHLKEDSNEA